MILKVSRKILSEATQTLEMDGNLSGKTVPAVPREVQQLKRSLRIPTKGDADAEILKRTTL
jgi:hypothetical protein